MPAQPRLKTFKSKGLGGNWLIVKTGGFFHVANDMDGAFPAGNAHGKTCPAGHGKVRLAEDRRLVLIAAWPRFITWDTRRKYINEILVACWKNSNELLVAYGKNFSIAAEKPAIISTKEIRMKYSTVPCLALALFFNSPTRFGLRRLIL